MKLSAGNISDTQLARVTKKYPDDRARLKLAQLQQKAKLPWIALGLACHCVPDNMKNWILGASEELNALIPDNQSIDLAGNLLSTGLRFGVLPCAPSTSLGVASLLAQNARLRYFYKMSTGDNTFPFDFKLGDDVVQFITTMGQQSTADNTKEN